MEIKVIQKECPRCQMSRAYDWIPGLTREENLAKHGWRWNKGRWICPSCAEKEKEKKCKPELKSLSK